MNKPLSPHRRWRILAVSTVCLLLVGLVLTAASANGTSTYGVTWYTFDGGGGTSSGSGYTVSGTIGQPDASSQSASGYSLDSGFWAWVARYLGYLPLLRKP